MSCSTCISKFGLTIINLLFLAAGAGLIVVGSFMCREYAHYSSIRSLGIAMIPAIIVIAVGILAIFLGLFGCVATCKRNKCLHGTYFTVLMIMLVAVIVGVILSLIYRSKIDDGMHEVMMKSMGRYLTDESMKAQVDLVQHDFNCCGVNNVSDWLYTEWYKNQSDSRKEYPESCCEKEDCDYYHYPDKSLHGKGCYIVVRDKFMQYFACIAAAVGGFALILVIGMVLNCVLVMRKRRTYEVPYVGLESDQHRGGMRI